MWNMVMAVDALLHALFSRVDPGIGDTLGSVLLWDVVVSVITAGILWLAIRMWQGCALGLSKDKPASEIEGQEGPLDVESALVAD